MALLNQQIAALRAQLGELQGLLDASAAKDAAAQGADRGAGQPAERGAGAGGGASRSGGPSWKRPNASGWRRRTPIWRSSGRNSSGSCRRFWRGARACGWWATASCSPPRCCSTPGSADLAPEGQAQIAGVVKILDEVAGKIPPGIDWIIRVDGHTDNVPLSGTGEFKDNWELSQARALSVVRYMQDQLGLSARTAGGDRVWRVSAGGGGRQPGGAGAEPADRVEADGAVVSLKRVRFRLNQRKSLPLAYARTRFSMEMLQSEPDTL